MVTDVPAFSLILVSEFLVNMVEPSLTLQSWRDADLDHSVLILTCGLRGQWKAFSVKDLFHFKLDSRIGRGRYCSAASQIAKFFGHEEQTNFGDLVVCQIRRIISDLTKDSDVVFPNFIHQIMEYSEGY
ncbi:unnamed protein product [Eruca vesicaria subsp. sativa]|uniref:Uncharacterized protein n=1 Tax=Eruca vesicaria subsp. sativa TaxID=29727 RepID=A0ABC8LNA2_ERUVS|nr:unnamed protein product [Eruca vesicaria subsp. sativa]